MREHRDPAADRQENPPENYVLVIDGREYPIPDLRPGYGVQVDQAVTVVRKDPAADRYCVIRTPMPAPQRGS